MKTKLKRFSLNVRTLICALTMLGVFFATSCEKEAITPLEEPTEDVSLKASSNSVNLNISSASASTEQSPNVASNVLDGSTNTRWSGYGSSVNFYVNLSSEATIDYLKIAYYKGDQRKSYIEIYTRASSNDSWNKVGTKTSSGNTTDYQTFDVSNSNGKYIKIVCKGTSSGQWNSITKLQVWGTGDSNGGGDNGGDNGGGDNGGGSSGKPSGVLNLSPWELTLPIPESSSQPNNPKDIYQPSLNDYSHSEYFHLNGSGNGVVFKAHCGGTTTSGSSYPRSELREMNSGYSSSSQKASWSTSSGTHTMFIRQAITHLPNKKKHVVAGQIHDKNDDVIVFRLEGSKLFIDINGNDGPTLTNNYSLGTEFTVKFVASGGKIKCYYNGSLKYTYSKKTSGCYFKAGCYTQSNTSKGDSYSAYGEVVIYDLWVSHN